MSYNTRTTIPLTAITSLVIFNHKPIFNRSQPMAYADHFDTGTSLKWMFKQGNIIKERFDIICNWEEQTPFILELFSLLTGNPTWNVHGILLQMALSTSWGRLVAPITTTWQEASVIMPVKTINSVHCN